MCITYTIDTASPPPSAPPRSRQTARNRCPPPLRLVAAARFSQYLRAAERRVQCAPTRRAKVNSKPTGGWVYGWGYTRTYPMSEHEPGSGCSRFLARRAVSAVIYPLPLQSLCSTTQRRAQIARRFRQLGGHYDGALWTGAGRAATAASSLASSSSPATPRAEKRRKCGHLAHVLTRAQPLP